MQIGNGLAPILFSSVEVELHNGVCSILCRIGRGGTDLINKILMKEKNKHLTRKDIVFNYKLLVNIDPYLTLQNHNLQSIMDISLLVHHKVQIWHAPYGFDSNH